MVAKAPFTIWSQRERLAWVLPISSPQSGTKQGWVPCGLQQLVVEPCVPVTEQNHESPDAEGSSKRELQQAEEGGDNGHDAAPLCALQQAPSSYQRQNGADNQESPCKMHNR